jgi:GAF domain-containing protein
MYLSQRLVKIGNEIIVPLAMTFFGIRFSTTKQSPELFQWLSSFLTKYGVYCLLVALGVKAVLSGLNWRLDLRSRENLKATLGKSLLEFMDKLQSVCVGRKSTRTRKIGELKTLSLNIATQLVPGKENATAILFTAEPSQDDGRGVYFAPSEDYCHGVHKSTTRFYEKDDEGKVIWEHARNHEPVTWNTSSKDRNPPYKRKVRRAYKTFITAPVYQQKSIHGLLTISSKRKRDLTDEDVAIMQIIASGLSSALSI